MFSSSETQMTTLVMFCAFPVLMLEKVVSTDKDWQSHIWVSYGAQNIASRIHALKTGVVYSL